jgi:DNA polymerase-1
VSKAQRQAAKAVVFGLLFGMGATSLVSYARDQYQVALSAVEAVDYIRRFYAAYPTLATWSQRQKQALQLAYAAAIRRRVYGGETVTSDGYRVASNEQHYRHSRGAAAPEPWEDEEGGAQRRLHTIVGAGETRTLSGRRRLAVGKGTEMLNSPIQGTASDIIKTALAQVWADRTAWPNAELILCVHDELDFVCPEADAEPVAAWAAEHMLAAAAAYLPDVPGEVEVAIGPSWDLSAAETRRVRRPLYLS